MWWKLSESRISEGTALEGIGKQVPLLTLYVQYLGSIAHINNDILTLPFKKVTQIIKTVQSQEVEPTNFKWLDLNRSYTEYRLVPVSQISACTS